MLPSWAHTTAHLNEPEGVYPMYLNETGYAELFNIPYEIVKIEEAKARAVERAMGLLTVSFERCKVTHSSFAVGGCYNEKQPDVSMDDINEHRQMVQARQQKIREEMRAKENARKADVLVFVSR